VVVDEFELRLCGPADAAGLAAMYTADRAELEGPDQHPAPTFFEADGQTERITNVWPEYQTIGFVMVDGGTIVGLFVVEDVVAGGSAVLGYYVASSRRNEGLATAALGQVIDRAFGQLELRRVIADIEADNGPSLRVVAHHGFHLEGPVTIDGVDYERWVLDRATRSDNAV
jgi:ribosomal-protein-alanine N-acetyltransferase